MGRNEDNKFMHSYIESGGKERFPDLEFVIDNIKLQYPIPGENLSESHLLRPDGTLNPHYRQIYRRLDDDLKWIMASMKATHIFNARFYPMKDTHGTLYVQVNAEFYKKPNGSAQPLKKE